jgi:hypothetical protein
MGLQTIIWKYDSFDWRVAMQSNYTQADVDASYQMFISNLTAGTFNDVGGIILTHELNNFTMQEAINWYPQLKSSFSVRGISQTLVPTQRLTSFFFLFLFVFLSAHRPHWCCSEHHESVP